MAVDVERLRERLEQKRVAAIETIDGSQWYVFDDFQEWQYAGHTTLIPAYRANGLKSARGDKESIALNDAVLL